MTIKALLHPLLNTAAVAAVALAMPSLADAKTPLPDRPVIESVPSNASTGKGGGGSSSFGMSASELARQDIVESNDAATSAELNRLMGLLRAQSPAPDARIAVHVISDPRPNAHTLDGGNIVVNEGLIRALSAREEKNDALAFVLAHEYAHALFNDPANQVAHANSLNGVGDSVSLAAQLSGASRHGGLSSGGCGGTGQSPMHALAGEAMTGEWLKSELYRASYGPFSRESEARADFLATDLLIKAKMNPVAGSRPIEDLFQNYDTSLKKRLEGQVKVVGDSMDGSMKDLGNCAPGLLQTAVMGGSLESQVKGFATGQLIGFMGNMVKARSNKENVHLYYSADERVSAVRAYSDKFYQGQIADSATDLSAFGGTNTFAKFETQEMTASAADKIIDLNAQGRFQEAMAMVQDTKGTPQAQSVEWLAAAGTASRGTGDIKGAIAYLDAASKKPEAVGVVFRQLAVLNLEDGQHEKALAALDRGQAKIPDARQFIVTRITVHRAKGNMSQVYALAQQCGGMGDSYLADQCNKAAGLEEATSSTAKENDNGVINALKPLGGGLPGLWK